MTALGHHARSVMTKNITVRSLVSWFSDDIKERTTGDREKGAKFWKYLKYLGPVIALCERCVRTDKCYSICYKSVITRCNKRYLKLLKLTEGITNATSIITCDDRKTTTGNASVFEGNVFPDAISNDR